MRELPADATRQYIDAVATFEAYEEALAEAAKVRGGMYWHKGPASAPDEAYLVRTSASGSEKSLGPRQHEQGARRGTGQGDYGAAGQGRCASEIGGEKMRNRFYLPLDQETRTHVDTECAAFHLSRKPQTMRVWASLENGPLRPIRVNRRLAWPVAELRRLLLGD